MINPLFTKIIFTNSFMDMAFSHIQLTTIMNFYNENSQFSKFRAFHEMFMPQTFGAVQYFFE